MRVTLATVGHLPTICRLNRACSRRGSRPWRLSRGDQEAGFHHSVIRVQRYWGIVPALLEGYQHFGEDRYAQAAVRGARTLAAAVAQERPLSSLYFGLAVLDLVRSRFDGQWWADQFELLGGNAGISLGATRAGDLDLAVLAVTPYLAAGTLACTGRSGPESRPGSITCRTARSASCTPERIERYSYGWCHGPAGDAQPFRLLGQVTKDITWQAVADRCWYTVTHSGLPQPAGPPTSWSR